MVTALQSVKEIRRHAPGTPRLTEAIDDALIEVARLQRLYDQARQVNELRDREIRELKRERDTRENYLLEAKRWLKERQARVNELEEDARRSTERVMEAERILDSAESSGQGDLAGYLVDARAVMQDRIMAREHEKLIREIQELCERWSGEGANVRGPEHIWDRETGVCVLCGEEYNDLAPTARCKRP